MLGHWFKHDVMPLLEERLTRVMPSAGPFDSQNASANQSWYSIVSGVVISSIHQFILMRLSFHTAGGKTDQYDFKTLSHDIIENKGDLDKTNIGKLMMKILMEMKTFSAFPIYPYPSIGSTSSRSTMTAGTLRKAILFSAPATKG